MFHEKLRPGDAIGVRDAARPGARLPTSRPCGRCGATCAAAYCCTVCEERAYEAWCSTVFVAIPSARLVKDLGLTTAAIEKWARVLAADGELRCFWGRDGLRAVGRPLPRGRAPLGARAV